VLLCFTFLALTCGYILTHCPLFLIGKGRNTETLTTEGKSSFKANTKNLC
jgi:hypothetical protein